MIREFMKSNSKKDLVIISNVEKNKFYSDLRKATNFESDSRIKFVGTVYNSELLKFIREHAYAYLHGHEVGGTNPSLLEALGSTKVNLLLNVGFNKEVGMDSSLYWNKEKGNLAELINRTDKLNKVQIEELNDKSSNVIFDRYDWTLIINEYEERFLKEF